MEDNLKTAKFSVLMSVYIKEKPKYLDEALNSLFNQTLIPDEVILVEDGPLTLELEKVIEKYKIKYDQKIKLVKLTQNSGLGIALNEGIKRCSYDYIARMDTDDISYDNRFEVQMKFLSKHKSIDVLGCNIDEYDENMVQKISLRKVPELDIDIKKYLKNRNPINHPTVIFKKSCVEKVGGYDNFLYFEDYYLWAKLISKGYIFHNIQDPLYKFRTSPSMYNRRGGLKYCKYIFAFEKAVYKLKLINLFELIINILKRCMGAIIPNSIRTYIYKKYYREQYKKGEDYGI